MDATIRHAVTADAARIRHLARESWHAAYDGILGPETVESVVDRWYDRERLEASIARDDGRFLVAEPSEESDSGLVGFAQGVLGDEDSSAELPRIYVHPDHWGEGVGSELLARIEAWVREQGADRLRLVVLADNEGGNAFYEARGYSVVENQESELCGDTYAEYVRAKDL